MTQALMLTEVQNLKLYELLNFQFIGSKLKGSEDCQTEVNNKVTKQQTQIYYIDI